MKTRPILATTLALCSALSLSGCLVYPPLPTDGDFPDPASASTRDGSFPNMDNLRMVAPGQTKQQVYELIGPPHFNEAVFHVRYWNYLLHLRNGDQTMTCQFQISFDSHSRVTATRWKDHACEEQAGVRTADEAGASASPAQ